MNPGNESEAARSIQDLVDRGTPRRRFTRMAPDRIFLLVCLVATTGAILVLAVLLANVLATGLPRLSLAFLDSYASRDPDQAGIRAPLWGSIWISSICGVVAVPIGVATAIHLEEFARRPRLTAFVKLNIANLAGVPSIVYGILGLTLFVRMFGFFGPVQDPAFEIGGQVHAIYYDTMGEPIRVPVERRNEAPRLESGTTGFMQIIEDGPDGELVFTNRWEPLTLTVVPEDQIAPEGYGVIEAWQAEEPSDFETERGWYHVQFPFGQSVLAGGLTLTLVVLPIVILSSQEAIRAVPRSLRDASLAVGATKWQTVRHVVLPSATPMILTGVILAMSRAIGEAAPILVLGVALFLTDIPESLMDRFTVLPMQIYNWTSRPLEEFRELAAAAIVVLLTVLLAFNSIAVVLRSRLQRGDT